MRSFFALLLMTNAASAFECNFTTECYEAEGCDTSAFALDVEEDSQTIATEAGDWTIVAKRRVDDLVTVFATGKGADYLLSVTPTAARLSAHMNEGPMVITYLGACEGAFQ